MFLAELLMKFPKLMTNKIVLELGAGCGCTSLIALKNKGIQFLPKKLILTDNTDIVLNNLKINVELNLTDHICMENEDNNVYDEKNIKTYTEEVAIDQNVKRELVDKKCVVNVRHLDFSTVTSEEISEYNADIILCADCTYSDDLCTYLIPVFEKFVNKNGNDTLERNCSEYGEQFYPKGGNENNDTKNNQENLFLPYGSNINNIDFDIIENSWKETEKENCIPISQNRPICLIAVPIRHPETFSKFIKQLQDSNIYCYDITAYAIHTVEKQIFYYEDREAIKILLIQ